MKFAFCHILIYHGLYLLNLRITKIHIVEIIMPTIYQWLGVILQSLQCVSNWVTTVLHLAIGISHLYNYNHLLGFRWVSCNLVCQWYVTQCPVTLWLLVKSSPRKWEMTDYIYVPWRQRPPGIHQYRTSSRYNLCLRNWFLYLYMKTKDKKKKKDILFNSAVYVGHRLAYNQMNMAYFTTLFFVAVIQMAVAISHNFPTLFFHKWWFIFRGLDI